MLTSFTQLFWQRYIQLTHENLQRSLSISTASFVYIVGINPADQNANQIQCLDQQHYQLLKSYTTVAHIRWEALRLNPQLL
ncbi:hypothetical protein HUN01_29530 [Nostoc edaphicum CCNP1411]|uniref:Uncharacterized protein n=1 Tax=Nostoc edaphicum CCNP1411 TaxID=1472755 RepID=A0A7D7QFF3_9NOSO|nr:hypothetical protein [Nostoc edaphicum]QMS91539.1 hypothetical protein HUN01_29530 [Nostoc edaphicum CCNP1411]